MGKFAFLTDSRSCMIRSLLHFILKIMARAVLWRHRPLIIAVTGSVGKTTTKEAIFRVVSKKYTVRESLGNYNNEIGLPLAIVGAESGRRNLLQWLKLLPRWIGALVSARYPRVLVLEMGADRPGDIAYLARIARPDIAVVTRVGSAHAEFLGDSNSIQREKLELIKALPPAGTAILNMDDPRVAAMRQLHVGRTIGYGLTETAEVRASGLTRRQKLGAEADPSAAFGLEFEIDYKTERTPVVVPGLLGHCQVYALLAAYTVGRVLEIDGSVIAESFSNFTPPPGRLRLIGGVDETVIIDDTYNSSPEAVIEALKALKQIRARRRIAVLGDMLELGAESEVAHRKIGRLVRDFGVDVLWTVGSRARAMAEEARRSGFAKTKVREYRDAREAASDVRGKIQPGDVVLVKGSQGMRMERVVERLMGQPERAGELLVRQDKSWKKSSI